MSNLILYTTEDGRSQIKLRTGQHTVWLTQLEMAELFDATKQNISLHLKNVFEDGELDEGSVVKESLTTAAELITARANPSDPHFGLLARKGNKVRKADIVVAKNYLTEDEIDTLNRLVVIFLETAELRAKSKQETRMSFWKQNVDRIITSNDFPLLTRAGSTSHEQMEQRTAKLYLEFDQDRRRQEATQADQADEADLNALEIKIKRRPKK